jgi:hypothetical protein
MIYNSSCIPSLLEIIYISASAVADKPLYYFCNELLLGSKYADFLICHKF